MIGEETEISFVILLLGVGFQVGFTIIFIFTPTWIRKILGIKAVLLVVSFLYVICAFFIELADRMLTSDSYLLVWLVVKNSVIGLTLGFMFEIARLLHLKLR